MGWPHQQTDLCPGVPGPSELPEYGRISRTDHYLWTKSLTKPFKETN